MRSQHIRRVRVSFQGWSLKLNFIDIADGGLDRIFHCFSSGWNR